MNTPLSQPAGFTLVELPPALIELVLRHRGKIEALAMAGVFEIAEGKAIVHFKAALVQGVQVEKWTYQRRAPISTPPSRQQDKKVIP